MDADHAPTRLAAAPQGGSIEPTYRAPIVKDLFQTPLETPGERYELRDTMADLTYRSNSFTEMIVKAERLGSRRFTAIDAQGRRTTVERVDGEWQRGPQRPAAPERPLDPLLVRDEVPDVASAEAPDRLSATVKPQAPRPRDLVDTQAVARLDAQAEREALVARVEAALLERYLIKRAPVTIGDTTIGRTEYRFRGDTSRVAFTASTFRLATDTNSPSVARSMVDVAEARNWQSLRVSGNEDFRRLVWLEASVRGVKTLGYEPMPADLEVLRRERESRQINRIEPARGALGEPAAAPPPTEKGSARGGGGGRKVVLAAIDAVLVAQRVPEKQRVAVIAAATEKLAQRVRDGQTPKVRIYDRTAPSQRPVTMPTPDVQRTRDRAAPSR